jgi:anaerobic selenocysteine-containing dehydrogenase
VPTVLNAAEAQPEGFTLVTLRSHDQFNTTVYGFSDRLRGLEGDRMILLMSPADMQRLQVAEGQRVALRSQSRDGLLRRVEGLAVTPYDLPRGCLGGYFPELNPLIPLDHHDQLSKTPAAKGIPVIIEAVPV